MSGDRCARHHLAAVLQDIAPAGASRGSCPHQPVDQIGGVGLTAKRIGGGGSLGAVRYFTRTGGFGFAIWGSGGLACASALSAGFSAFTGSVAAAMTGADGARNGVMVVSN